MNIIAHYLNDDPKKIIEEIRGDINEVARQALESSIQSLINNEFINFIEGMFDSGSKDYRNGSYTRKLHSSLGEINISIPRDRVNLYETVLLKPYSRVIDDLDGLIQTLYLKGLTQKDIVMQIEDMTGHKMSRATIAKVASEMLEDAQKYRTRPIPDCPIVYLDGTYVPFKTIDANGNKYVVRECIELAVGVTRTGEKMVLGYLIHPNEGKQSWIEAMNDLKQRGLSDPRLFITDGLNGMVDAIHEVFPNAKHQRCLVHICRNIVNDVHKADRKAIAADFHEVYDKSVTTRSEFRKRLLRFVEKWQHSYPRRMRCLARIDDMDTYLDFPMALRTSLYTTNLIESLNSMIKTETKKRRLINSEENGIIVLASAFLKYERAQRRIRGISELTEEERLSIEINY